MQKKELLEHLETFMTPRRRQLFTEVLNARTNFFTVATQDVYQLHNTSAVIRSCDVFGVQNVHVVEEVNTKRIDREIAMGAQNWVDINRYNTTAGCIEQLRKKDYKIMATSPHEGTLLHDYKISGPRAIFFGTEKDGLSLEVLEEADELVQIPMVGFTESLNISVSAAIILQHLTTNLRQSNWAWQLSEEEKLEKRWDWTCRSVKNSKSIIERFLASK